MLLWRVVSLYVCFLMNYGLCYANKQANNRQHSLLDKNQQTRQWLCRRIQIALTRGNLGAPVDALLQEGLYRASFAPPPPTLYSQL
ncbi:hypothetical protein BGX38DRAFT_1163328, partial [Terfezia claveryi]